MHIVVCIKQVPASNKVDVDPVTGVLKRSGTESKMNPYDLYALETALRIREQAGGEITAVTMGPGQAQTVLREAFAMGADHGVLLSDRRFAGADVLATSRALSQAIRRLGSFDLILTGKQTTDGDTAQVGPAISEWLNIPCAANVRGIEQLREGDITVRMELPDAVEISRIAFPCLLSVDKDIFMPRLPSYLRKKASADREITVWSLDDMSDTDPEHYGLSGSPTQVQRIFPPEPLGDRELWTGDAPALTQRLFDRLSDMKFI